MVRFRALYGVAQDFERLVQDLFEGLLPCFRRLLFAMHTK